MTSLDVVTSSTISLSSDTLRGTNEERLRAGRALRKAVPLSAHADWVPPAGRQDPVELLEENNRPRLVDLVPVRYGRMLASPFAFLRGAAVVMAHDLAAAAPETGIRLQTCGDGHLGNFGVFGTPARNLFFDVMISTRRSRAHGSGT